MKSKKFKSIDKLVLPTLRGKIGDWFYYSTILTFEEVEKRVHLPMEIDEHSSENEKLGDWIQRELNPSRTKRIVEYLKNQPQRFFNSLILGIYGGKPSFQELDVTLPDSTEEIPEKIINYLNRTFGVLTLNGDEKIFAIDGQHRAVGIREAVKKNSNLREEEISVIFLGHNTSTDGKVRTRRLFSTLNRYAKPVNQSEIIALSEDDNCAVITRNLIENPLLKNRILINKNRSINPDNKTSFTNILTLYDIVKRILTDEKVVSIPVLGKSVYSYTVTRVDDDEINSDTSRVLKVFDLIIDVLPSLKRLFNNEQIDRTNPNTNLIFRPIGQNIVFDVYKVAEMHGKIDSFLQFLSKESFNLNNTIWKTIFWDEETGTIVTEKARQRFATLLILEALNITVKRTAKDEKIYENFGLKATQIYVP